MGKILAYSGTTMKNDSESGGKYLPGYGKGMGEKSSTFLYKKMEQSKKITVSFSSRKILNSTGFLIREGKPQHFVLIHKVIFFSGKVNFFDLPINFCNRSLNEVYFCLQVGYLGTFALQSKLKFWVFLTLLPTTITQEPMLHLQMNFLTMVAA